MWLPMNDSRYGITVLTCSFDTLKDVSYKKRAIKTNINFIDFLKNYIINLYQPKKDIKEDIMSLPHFYTSNEFNVDRLYNRGFRLLKTSDLSLNILKTQFYQNQENKHEEDEITKLHKENEELRGQLNRLFNHIDELSNEIKKANTMYQSIIDKMMEDKPSGNATIIKGDK